MKKKGIYILLLTIIMLMVITGCKNGQEDVAIVEDDYIPVEVETAQIKDLGNNIMLQGKIYANDEAMVLPKIPGRVSEVRVNLGDIVEKDTILFVMDQEDINRSIEQAQKTVELAQTSTEQSLNSMEQTKNGIETAKINYESIKDNIENAEKNLNRTKELFEAGAVSQVQLEQAELAASRRPLEVAEAQIRQAEMAYNQAQIGYDQTLNQLAQAQLGYEQALSALDDTIVRAPISGVISSLNVVAGELASGAQPLATIADVDKLYFRTDVTENMVNNLKEGQKVSLHIPSAMKGEIEGKIDFISPTPDARTQLYMVKVYIDNTDHNIKAGMSGHITLDTESRQDVLVINTRGVLDRDGEYYVMVAEGDYAVEKKVTIGMETSSEVEIVDGLESGDKVIVKGQHYVSDGEKIKIVGGE